MIFGRYIEAWAQAQAAPRRRRSAREARAPRRPAIQQSLQDDSPS